MENKTYTIIKTEKEENGNTYFRVFTGEENFNYFVNKSKTRENLGDSLKCGDVIEGEVTGTEGKRFMREIKVIGFEKPHAIAPSVPKEQRPDLRSKEKNNLQQCKANIISALLGKPLKLEEVKSWSGELFKLL